MSIYDLPDPLPDKLPGESNKAYCRRVIPFYAEFKSPDYTFRKRKRRARDDMATRLGRTLTDSESDTAAREAWRGWVQDFPERAARYVELFPHVIRP